ncbi:MAG: RNA-binding protein [Alphaproteobacteria bacterium]|nr:RNA-binding protein [Alphaproteobacteria bacterium]
MPHAEQTTRTCLVSGDAMATRAMIRFVVGPENEIVPDLQERLPGRGLWVAAKRAAIESAATGKVFAKAAKAAVKAPADLADRVAILLKNRCLDTLGLARRAGLVTCGADRVRDVLERGAATALIEARDGSPAERAKFTSLAGPRPVVDCFSRGELASAVGREDVVHVALTPGGLSDLFLRDSARFAGVSAAAG